MAQAMSDSHHEQDWVPTDTFGARLALIRQAKGWNVKEAAEACGLNDDSWRNWETGRSPRGMEQVAQRIAEVAGCNYVWLMVGGPLARSRCFAALDGVPGVMSFDDMGWQLQGDLAAVS